MGNIVGFSMRRLAIWLLVRRTLHPRYWKQPQGIVTALSSSSSMSWGRFRFSQAFRRTSLWIAADTAMSTRIQAGNQGCWMPRLRWRLTDNLQAHRSFLLKKCPNRNRGPGGIHWTKGHAQEGPATDASADVGAAPGQQAGFRQSARLLTLHFAGWKHNLAQR